MSDQEEGEFSNLPHGVDLDRPSVARIYDYLLGGYHNFEVDRRIADEFSSIFPDLALTARVNRAFLRRVATFVSNQGIDQFLDLGSGIPTVGNVHEIVRRQTPDARTVYVDIEPVAVAHSQAILADDPGVTAILADVRRPDEVLDHPDVRKLLDFSRPVGLFAVALLHFLTEEGEAKRVIDAYKAVLAPGSYLTIGVWTYDDAPRDVMDRYSQMTHRLTTVGRPRSREEVLSFFDGFELLEPGLVHSPLWRPEGPDDAILDEPGRSITWVGVARKP
jgi:hypothetical protein